MNILVTGSNGQLGSELKTLSNSFPNFNLIFTDIQELDITKPDAVMQFAEKNPFQIIINCAAYTAVDKAEEEPEIAHLINVDSVKNLAFAANLNNALLIHISTDYVFGGEGFQPYTEDNALNPNSIYAKTKALGEDMVLKHANRSLIIRTSWLYSSFGNNFVKTMIKYGTERDQLNVVFDQIGTPTYAADLAKTILEIAEKSKETKGKEIYHYSNEGVCSWYDFALAIMEEKNIDCKIHPILSKEYPLPASRPFYSVLDKTKIKSSFTLEIPHWKESLKICLRKI